MGSNEHDPGQRRGGIGADVERAREAAGLTLRDLEDRTKIRRRYLEAIEAERWTALPSSAHASAFLRTVASELGLDPDELADRFRREVEPPVSSGDPGGPSRWPVLAAVALLAGAGVAAVAVVGDDSEDGARRGGDARDRAGAHRSGGGGGDGPGGDGGRARSAPGEPFELTLSTRGPVDVCLVADDDRALIDSQLLAAGTSEGPFQGDEFRLDLLSGGAVRASIGGDEGDLRLRSDEPARWRITARGARPQPMRRVTCP